MSDNEQLQNYKQIQKKVQSDELVLQAQKDLSYKPIIITQVDHPIQDDGIISMRYSSNTSFCRMVDTDVLERNKKLEKIINDPLGPINK